MPQDDPNREIREYIRGHFPPGLRDMTNCFAWISEQVRGHIGHLIPPLYREFENVAHEINQQFSEQRPGVFVLLDPGDKDGPTFVKRPRSIVEKMLRSQKDHDRQQKMTKKHRRVVTVHTHDGFLESMDDLVRFRLLCNYLSDIETVVDQLRSRYEDDGGKLRLKQIKDLLWIAPEQRKSGHRAVHLAFQYRQKGVRLGFEVQVTTILHWGWDKKDHSLVYEPMRMGSPPSQRDRSSIAAASDTLFLVDEYFDGLRASMSGIGDNGKDGSKGGR